MQPLQDFVERSLRGQWVPHLESSRPLAESWAWVEDSGRRWEMRSESATSWDTSLQVVLYGSSHLRELQNAWVRDKMQLSITSELPLVVTHIPSRSSNASDACFREGNVLDCVDLDACGPPGYRIVDQLSGAVSFGFNGFVHTPLAEALFLERLSRDGMRHPHVLVLDIGVWGPRANLGHELGLLVYNRTLTVAEEMAYFVEWVHDNFATSLIIWVHGYCQLKNWRVDLTKCVEDRALFFLVSMFL